MKKKRFKTTFTPSLVLFSGIAIFRPLPPYSYSYLYSWVSNRRTGRFINFGFWGPNFEISKLKKTRCLTNLCDLRNLKIIIHLDKQFKTPFTPSLALIFEITWHTRLFTTQEYTGSFFKSCLIFWQISKTWRCIKKVCTQLTELSPTLIDIYISNYYSVQSLH